MTYIYLNKFLNVEMKKILIPCIFLFSLVSFINAQSIQGQIFDANNKMPLIGVNITLENINQELIGTASDLDGKFELNNLQVGKYKMSISYIGFLMHGFSSLFLRLSGAGDGGRGRERGMPTMH